MSTTEQPTDTAQPADTADSMGRLWQLAFGSMPAQIIHAAVRLGVPDALAAGARTSADLAGRTGAHEPSLRRLLRGMAAVGIAAATEGGYELTPMGRPLCADAPDSVRDMVLLFAGEAMWRSWGELAETVRSGRNGFERIHGLPYFEYYAQQPDEYAVFNGAMGADTAGAAPSLAKGYDFSWCTTVVDVGGGNGALLAEVLSAHPHLRGIVFDRAEGVAQAAGHLDAKGVADRCAVAAGNAFESVVAGGDLYVVKSVLHDWDDDSVRKILGNIRAVLHDQGRVVVMEPLMPGDDADLGPAHGIVTTDMDLLVTTRGRVRTEAEFAGLFADAGLRLTSARKLADHGYLEAQYHSLIEGVPA
ncbi:methyltransferase [Saccharopolyspora sp. 5N708]|uniref:methyltransferase n=1 Tax=Saccharopolyspora sp. 5N708 TaxID=3457424 RepID=UPI003FD2243D